MQNFKLKFEMAAEKTAKHFRGLLYFAAPCRSMTDGRTDGGDCITSRANAVGKYFKHCRLHIKTLLYAMLNARGLTACFCLIQFPQA